MLGCFKNLVDFEDMIIQLCVNDFEVVYDSNEEDVNVIIVNMCGFIDLVKEEFVNMILQYVEVKKEGGIDKFYVMGCLLQCYKDDLEKEIFEVDVYFGILEFFGLFVKLNVDYKYELIGECVLIIFQYFVYLKISEGCNCICFFCVILLMCGKYVSKFIEVFVKEVENLVCMGVKELMLIVQELIYYGFDIYKEWQLL